MLEGITSDDLNRLARDFRELDRDFGAAVNRELRAPIRKGAAVFKAAAKANFPSWAAADAASEVC